MKEFRHGGICDCTCLCPSKLTDKCFDNVCGSMIKETGKSCEASGTLEEMFETFVNESSRLAVVYFDAKIDGIAREVYPLAGQSVANFTKKLFDDGFMGQVIISSGSMTGQSYIQGAIDYMKSQASFYSNRVFYTYDMENKEYDKVVDLLKSQTPNRLYSTGITTCAQMTKDWSEVLEEATERGKEDKISGIGIWTLDLDYDIEHYLRHGATMILSNVPRQIVKVLDKLGGKLAKPGNALRLQEFPSDDWFHFEDMYLGAAIVTGVVLILCCCCCITACVICCSCVGDVGVCGGGCFVALFYAITGGLCCFAGREKMLNWLSDISSFEYSPVRIEMFGEGNGDEGDNDLELVEIKKSQDSGSDEKQSQESGSDEEGVDEYLQSVIEEKV